MDIPGGGFICMTPLHHEERLLRWAIRTKRVVISFDYGKVSPGRPRSCRGASWAGAIPARHTLHILPCEDSQLTRSFFAYAGSRVPLPVRN
jgi:hypothetical protein